MILSGPDFGPIDPALDARRRACRRIDCGPERLTWRSRMSVLIRRYFRRVA
jgi:hypothetical protein